MDVPSNTGGRIGSRVVTGSETFAIVAMIILGWLFLSAVWSAVTWGASLPMMGFNEVEPFAAWLTSVWAPVLSIFLGTLSGIGILIVMIAKGNASAL